MNFSSSKNAKRINYDLFSSMRTQLICFIKILSISEHHRPRQALQGEKVSLKIHKADLIDR